MINKKLAKMTFWSECAVILFVVELPNGDKKPAGHAIRINSSRSCNDTLEHRV
jgi:hypothetical protein